MLRVASVFALVGAASALQVTQPIVTAGAPNNDAEFGVSAQDGKAARPSSYRNAWDDCGGVGASKTEKMRILASKVKGWAAPVKFVRNAAQDCPGGKGKVYPGKSIDKAYNDGMKTATDALAGKKDEQ